MVMESFVVLTMYGVEGSELIIAISGLYTRVKVDATYISTGKGAA